MIIKLFHVDEKSVFEYLNTSLHDIYAMQLINGKTAKDLITKDGRLHIKILTETTKHYDNWLMISLTKTETKQFFKEYDKIKKALKEKGF